jgi:hypothetical protein
LAPGANPTDKLWNIFTVFQKFYRNWLQPENASQGQTIQLILLEHYGLFTQPILKSGAIWTEMIDLKYELINL